MNLLVDTHIYLWWLADNPTLAGAARKAIADPRSAVYVSAASIWEAAIKTKLGKLEVEVDLAEEIGPNGFQELPISALHAQIAGNLPRHHDDPFDRMLVAQAQLNEFVLVTRDRRLAAYDVALLPA